MTTKFASSHYKEQVDQVQASVKDASGHLLASGGVRLGGDHGADPGHAGGITSPSWPVSSWGSLRSESSRKLLGKIMDGLACPQSE